MVRVAFTTAGNDLNAAMEMRFGRTPKFLVYNTDTEEIEIVDNTQSMTAAQGAGVQAAETVVRAGAHALITAHCGPKAFRVLSAAGVKVYTCEASTVAEALQAYTSGTLHEAVSADVEGHW